MSVLQTLRNVLPGWLRRPLGAALAPLRDVHAARSYSQEGEDMVLRRIFAAQPRGFYVDVGAHHPRRFSNTCHFHAQGWSGINIEPNPAAVALFKRQRPGDINLQMGVADTAGSLTYYEFDEPALNTFDPALVELRTRTTPYRLVAQSTIPVEPLATILQRHLPAGQAIDFLTIDVEGLDLAVLRSNDWSRFRPRCVLVEALENSLESVLRGELYSFMSAHGYSLFAKTYNTLIFEARSA
jgi:FkbM family methyltransferase